MSTADGTEGQFYEGFMDDYFAECDEHLTAIRRLLLDAERQSGHMASDALQELFRSFHSVKGLSGMVGLREAEVLAHHMESYLRVLRDANAPATPEGVAALIHGTHALEQVIAATRGRIELPDIASALHELTGLADAGTPHPPPAAADARGSKWRVVFVPSAELAARGVGVDRVRAMLMETTRILGAVPRVERGGGISFEFLVEGDIAHLQVAGVEAGLTISPHSGGDAPAEAVADPARMAASSLSPIHYVRVDLSRLDDLMRMVGDLVIRRARLADSLARIEHHVPPLEWRTVQENTFGFERQLRDLRDGVMRVRLVRVGEVFRRMPFVVRDLARETGRHVHLAIEGQDTEIDKFVVERLMDPVLHLVRNAVSHGIEPAAARVAVGKPADGRVTLSASSFGDTVVLEVADDGGGVNRQAVAERARAVGMDVPSGPLDDATLLSLLCTPGFSTRDAADRASGRGVGMAVVETALEELGGRLSLATTPGEGTRFRLEVPLTLSITEAILGRVGTQTFAVPQASVHEVVEIAHTDVRRVEHHEIAPYRDGALPIVRLGTLFGLASSPSRALYVFVIGRGVTAVGLAVDRILGQREIVVRPLNDTLIKVDGLSGATDLGDGRAVLILDAARIAANARERQHIRTGASGGLA